MPILAGFNPHAQPVFLSFLLPAVHPAMARLFYQSLLNRLAGGILKQKPLLQFD